MDAVIEEATRQVLKEAIAEVRGRSSRKWATVIVAFAVGIGLGTFFGAYWNASQHAEPGDDEFQAMATPT